MTIGMTALMERFLTQRRTLGVAPWASSCVHRLRAALRNLLPWAYSSHSSGSGCQRRVRRR